MQHWKRTHGEAKKQYCAQTSVFNKHCLTHLTTHSEMSLEKYNNIGTYLSLPITIHIVGHEAHDNSLYEEKREIWQRWNWNKKGRVNHSWLHQLKAVTSWPPERHSKAHNCTNWGNTLHGAQTRTLNKGRNHQTLSEIHAVYVYIHFTEDGIKDVRKVVVGDLLFSVREKESTPAAFMCC